MMEQRNIRDHDIITIKNISDQDFTFEFDIINFTINQTNNTPYINSTPFFFISEKNFGY